MAKRFRRFRRRRVNPDRAWLITEFGISCEVENISDQTLVPNQAEVLMTFDEITAEESSLNREDSDWFVQRILLNWLPNMNVVLDQRYSKLYEYILFTMQNRLAEETAITASQDVINDAVYNRAARVLQTGVKPVHAHFNPRITTEGTQTGAQAVDAGGDDATAFVTATNWLGNEHVSLDISPKFGLKEGTNLYLGIGPFLKSDLWDNVNVLSIIGKAQILVQRKRR